ncbi:hypothetical protein NVP1034O_62 [Vibrio phage 1.034.O._10N.261.46.B7]|nr:hypothetical protein NVP1034O_62 [Vibrio phage 1.034.O._10N.261.46.B7]AUR83494.1 hypothetical protein NVP1034X_64 [Vibrio phage 1.034.X._10N.261.46.B7]
MRLQIQRPIIIHVPEYNELVGWNTGHFDTYTSAKGSKAVYKTGSTLDSLCIQGGTRGLSDMCEVCHMFKALAGNEDFEFGIELKDGMFIEIGELTQALIEAQERGEY